MSTVKGDAWADSSGLHLRIPAGGNEVYQKLKELVGEPAATERYALGLSAARIDRFPCGCVRTYTAGMIGGIPTAKEELDPCPNHRDLVPTPADHSETKTQIKAPKAKGIQERMF